MFEDTRFVRLRRTAGHGDDDTRPSAGVGAGVVSVGSYWLAQTVAPLAGSMSFPLATPITNEHGWDP